MTKLNKEKAAGAGMSGAEIQRTVGELVFTGDELKVRMLVQALSRVQGSLEGAKKDADNPHYKSKYATLHASWKVARKLLHDNGFAVAQLPVMHENGGVSLHTFLYHEDGASLDFFYPVTYAPCNAPQLGSALKYARRYSLETVVGITTEDDKEDDDGNTAPEPSRQAPQWKRSEPPAPAATVAGARPTLTDQAKAYIEKIQSAKTWEEFMTIIADAGDLVERIRAADKAGTYTARINEIVAEKRLALEPAGDTQQEVPQEQQGNDETA